MWRTWTSGAAPFITQAMNKRMSHENWGYLRMPTSYMDTISAWNRRRYGLEVDPATITLATGVHPALIAGYHAFSPPGSRVLLTTPPTTASSAASAMRASSPRRAR